MVELENREMLWTGNFHVDDQGLGSTPVFVVLVYSAPRRPHSSHNITETTIIEPLINWHLHTVAHAYL